VNVILGDIFKIVIILKSIQFIQSIENN